MRIEGMLKEVSPVEASLDIKDVILSVLLLLKDHIDEHYTAKYPLIDIEPIS